MSTASFTHFFVSKQHTFIGYRFNLTLILLVSFFSTLGFSVHSSAEIISYTLVDQPKTRVAPPKLQLKSTQRTHTRQKGTQSKVTQYSSSTSNEIIDYIDDEQSLPIYILSRASLAVPVDANHDILAVGAGFGIVKNPDFSNPKTRHDWAHQLGMRFIWVPEPPRNPLSDFQASVDWAWGPVVDWMAIASPRKRVSFYTNVSVGFIYGTPSKTKNVGFEETYGVKPTNLVLPIIEGGVGLRLLTKKLNSNNMRAFLSTEVGVVPGAMAPYAALSVGLL